MGAAAGGTTYDKYDGGFIGPMGNLGFGITFDGAPVTLGLDYRPMVAIVFGDETGVLTPGFWNFGLTVTYRF